MVELDGKYIGYSVELTADNRVVISRSGKVVMEEKIAANLCADETTLKMIVELMIDTLEDKEQTSRMMDEMIKQFGGDKVWVSLD